MNLEKHEETLKEVTATIEEALNSNDIKLYQRRITAMISLGVSQIIEYYFHKLNVIKPGAQIKHNWFASSIDKIKIKLESVLTMNISKINNLDELLVLAKKIEEDRNDLIYGSPIKSEKILMEKINFYLEIKRIIEDEIQ